MNLKILLIGIKKIFKALKRLIRFLIAYPRIPRGEYCYSKSRGRGRCPYWKRISFLHYQENGYCSYLKRGDIDRNNDDNYILQQINPKTGEIIKETPASEMPFGVGLLWDQCKECGIKEGESLRDDYEQWKWRRGNRKKTN